VLLSGRDASGDESAILSETVSTDLDAGDGGAIRIDAAGDVQILAGGLVSARSQGSGDAGDIRIDAGGTTLLVSGRVVTEAPGSSGSSPSPTFWAAELGCTPYYTDWSLFDRVDVSDDGILPNGAYEVRVIGNACALSDPGNYSSPLIATMSAVGDVVGDCSVCPCTGPDGVVDFVDISAVVEKFKDSPCVVGGPGVPRKARADLINSNVDLPKPDRKIDFVDISCIVDAFRGTPCVLPGPPTADPCPGLCP